MFSIQSAGDLAGQAHLNFIIVSRGDPVIGYKKVLGLILSSKYAKHVGDTYDRASFQIGRGINES